MMKIIQSPLDIQQQMLALKAQGKTIGFVPTMGNLHQGHLSLIEIAKQKSDISVASIFVNPMQFGEGEDLDSYPRTMSEDIRKLESLNVDYLFTPSNESIYPLGKDSHTSVEVNRMTDTLCGASRPGHFRGVTTVVNILFNIIQPNIAVFGKKDYQQYQVIKAMVKDLMLPIEIIGGEILREANGLAMSSRNGYLTVQEKTRASQLRKIILQTAEQLKQGKESIDAIKQMATEQLESSGFKKDYFEIVNQLDLADAKASDKKLLISAAAWMGKPRLIDNMELEINS
jgi:pantoate--beta-alanine ligase